MGSIAVFIIGFFVLILAVYAYRRHDGTFEGGIRRGVEQFMKLVPRMLCALIAAGFIAKLIPTSIISTYLGDEAGFTAVVIGTLTGLIVPSGPVISFAIAATFANAGASVPALVAFITSWSLFAAHRMMIYEIPLLGFSFLRLRVASVAIMPFAAGALVLLAYWLLSQLGK
jgi:uncharacterized membrane protein YraQ (UPF0718 family)